MISDHQGFTHGACRDFELLGDECLEEKDDDHRESEHFGVIPYRAFFNAGYCYGFIGHDVLSFFL
jgi:hypothetical protein